MSKIRIDTFLVDRCLAPSRERAKSIIMAGVVFVDGERVDKPGTTISDAANVEVSNNPNKYVSRGGLKLEKAMNTFNIDLNGAIAMDIGASTGGFTDCMLQNGAKKVYAVDVGYGQLAWILRQDPRVVVMERTNIRYVTNEKVTDELDFVSIDVSFISLKLVLPVAHRLLCKDGRVVCLIKPQFEAGRDKVGKKGVVRDINVHREVINKIIDFALSMGFNINGLDFSPIKGPEGNIEYLLYLSKSEPTVLHEVDGSRSAKTASDEVAQMVQNVVGRSHTVLNEMGKSEEDK